ncbi:MAG: hypothetical protein FWG48_01275 [Oscillospiraceae bacterium]|nr:hypothetical protein [Oscillospiraceae bacterium]
MIYPRHEYGDPAVKTVKSRSFFGGGEFTLPAPDYPITPVENFKRSALHDKPMWVPNPSLDCQTISPNDMILPTEAVKGQCVCMDFSNPHTADYTFTDWFLTDWTYVHSAGGPMLTPGFSLCDDVTNWEKCAVFPKFDDWDWETFHSNFMKNEYDPAKALSTDIGLGCTERFVSIMGGYTEAMMAFATEPDACKDFFNAFIDHEIEQFDRIMKLYPITRLTYHDDWSNERDTFFSPAMLEYMLMEPTKRFVDHVKKAGCVFEFHCCGNLTRFLPYFVELGVNLLQMQRRAVDFIQLKKDYGTVLGFGSGIEGFDMMKPPPPKEELVKMIRDTVDLFAPTGGFYAFSFMRDPELLWLAADEFYAYSREFYDKENA